MEELLNLSSVLSLEALKLYLEEGEEIFKDDNLALDLLSDFKQTVEEEKQIISPDTIIRLQIMD